MYYRSVEYTGVCWWCVHKASVYVGCPVKLIRGPKSSEMCCRGYFCSYQCALAWGVDNSYKNVRSLVYLVSRRNYDSDGDVKAAPKRELLQLFGGHLTIEQFRSTTESIPKKRKVAKYRTHNSKPLYKVQKVSSSFGLNYIN